MARDPVTGETYKVPEGMTYAQWRKAQAEKYGEDTLQVERIKIQNATEDLGQWKRYQKVLGKDRFMKDLDSFQAMKYGNPEFYDYIKLDYRRRNRLINHPELALPNASKATAAEKKFTKYFFNPDNPKGWAKGIAFDSRLGYNKENWPEFRAEIIMASTRFPVKKGGTDAYGTGYSQSVVLYGKKGKPMSVTVGWKEQEGKTWMATVVPEKIKKGTKSSGNTRM